MVFSEDFNGFFGGNQNALQFQSGLKVSFGGNVPGWDKAGGGVVHAVDRNGTGDFAPMIWQDNVITQSSGIPVNTAAETYTVSFSGGPAVYAAPSQVTAAEDGIVIDVLRGDDSVLATYTYMPGAWAGAQTFAPASFTYVGDGSGVVRLRVGPLSASGHFAGAIDNLTVSDTAVATPPVFSAQPTGGSVVEGNKFSFSAAASGAPTFQWRKNGSPISGATNATYTVTNARLSDGGTYTVVATTPGGFTVSDPAVLTVTPAPVLPGVLLSERFDGYTGGNQNALQFETGLKVSHSGNLPGWNKAGGGVVHAVDKDGAGDYAAMIWQDNVITLAAGIAANTAFVPYTVDFLGGPCVYSAGSQVTAATDGLVIDVLRADNSVLATYTFMPGAWAGAQTFAPGSFQYIGDGSGPVRVRVGPLSASGHFAGAIDNLRVVRGTYAFVEEFNGYTGGNQNALQFQSGLKISHSGNLPLWNKAGGGVVHAVDRNGIGNFAPMMWQDNVITLASGITANGLNENYSVEFFGAPATYSEGTQATTDTDGIVFDVLRGDDSVLATYTYMPGAWAGAPNFTPGSFTYTGDGSGPVRLRVGPLAASGHFAGAVDSLTVMALSVPQTAPTFATQPTGGTVAEGDFFTFTAAASGTATYQWRRNGDPILGATAATYSIGYVTPADAGTYTVVLTNTAGTATSDPAVLAVTPAPVFANYAEAVLTDNPIHYYPLDDIEGTVAEDLGSLATAGGTYTGGFALGQTSASEALGSCVYLDGAPGSLVDLGVFHPGESVTVEAWANLDPSAFHNPGFHIVVSRWDGSYEIDLAPGDVPNFNIRRDGNGFGQAVAASPSLRGTWYHLVLVFSGGKLTGYVNGVRTTEQNIGGTLQDAGPTPDRVMIGATRNGSESSFNWKGFIDEVAIYDTALTAAQIRGHLRAGAPGPQITASSRTGNDTSLSFTTFPGFSYRHQYSENLGQWFQLGDLIPGDGTVKSATDSSASGRRFYRVGRVP